jgi:hypothetical protein
LNFDEAAAATLRAPSVKGGQCTGDEAFNEAAAITLRAPGTLLACNGVDVCASTRLQR